jgi:hypothetical protein
MTDSVQSLYLQATIDADVSAATQTMAVNQETLYIHEVDRSGSLVVCQVTNYANFDVSATVFANGISYKDGGTDESGNTFEFDGAATAAAATLYDVHFAKGSFAATSALISDLITVVATDVHVKELTFSGADIAGANKAAFDGANLSDVSHGSVEFTFTYDPSGRATDSTVSTQIVYSVDVPTEGAPTLTVTKDDNVLATDKVGFGIENSGPPAANGDDLLSADLVLSNSLFDNQTVDFTGSVSDISITAEALTSAINNLIDHSGNLADAQDDIEYVKAALLAKVESGDFLGLTSSSEKNITIDLKLQVGSQPITTETIENIRPQIFFGKFTRAELNNGSPTTALSA